MDIPKDMLKKLDIQILYEDTDVVVINKPAGLVVHGDGKREEYAITHWFIEHYPGSANVGEPIVESNGSSIYRPGIVHRLDRDTSGALILAKTASGHAHIKSQFQNRLITKRYIGFVYGHIEDTYGVIERPIGRSSKDFRKWSAERRVKGELRDAITWYTTLHATKQASLVEIEPKTGRTHQIRVHFSAIHHPIVADKLYAPGRLPILGFNRQALHAYETCWVDSGGVERTVQAPLPEDFRIACAEVGYQGDLLA